MSFENEYIIDSNKGSEVIDSTTDNKKKKKDRKVEKQSVNQQNPEGNFISSFRNRWDAKKTIVIFGAITIFLSFYIVLGCVSYLFTWKTDQSEIIGKGFWEYIFESNIEQVANWNGKFGAWISHFLIFDLFGISAFAIPFITFLFGVKLLTNTHLLPLRKTTLHTTTWILFGSLFFGYFSNYVNFVGGKFGFYTNHWLAHTVGKFGAFLFILLAIYVVLVSLYNPNFGDILLNLYERFVKSEDDEENETLDSEENIDQENRIRIKKTVIPDIPEDNMDVLPDNEFITKISQEPNDDLNHEFSETNNTNDFLVELEDTKSNTFNPIEESPFVSLIDEEDDFQIEVPTEPVFISPSPVITPLAPETDFQVEVGQQEELLSEHEADELRQEYGDYDPTLDLSGYVLPSIELLRDYGNNEISFNKQEIEENKNKIVETLMNYKIEIAQIKATIGPTVTLYEIVPAPGVRISKIKNLEDDIALSLSALGIRIIAPIPGKGTIGIEVPNSNPKMVSMRSLIASEKFQNSDHELPVVLGKTITNETYTFDLTKMPHLLVAGSTGQGKSVGLNAILVSILYKKHPAQVKFVLVDPKKVELTLYNKIERHFLAKLPGEEDAIITDTSKVVNTLNSLCIEMDARYELLKDAQVRTIKEYNAKFISRRLNPEKGHRYLPYIVVLIDEFADLIMTAGKEVEHPIARIAQLARAVGIHLIVATQRPSVNVITGMIKANFPARIAFRVLSKIDSRTILDQSGADQLIGRGDMLISTGQDLIRLQCGFVDTPEVESICDFIGNQRAYPEALLLPEYVGEDGGASKDFDLDDIDSMFADAARIVVMHQQGSASLLQRKLKLGYNRAGRIVDQLEAFGIIGPFQGAKAREVLYQDPQALEELLQQKNIG
ncbi:MAG: DNA translocase FtsK 4TM domain-containing protein [Crocinitomicaceae bacterium]|jgi:S-DNA-T family DNA segregation ATPase FtsK/SpoIIIE